MRKGIINIINNNIQSLYIDIGYMVNNKDIKIKMI